MKSKDWAKLYKYLKKIKSKVITGCDMKCFAECEKVFKEKRKDLPLLIGKYGHEASTILEWRIRNRV